MNGSTTTSGAHWAPVSAARFEVGGLQRELERRHALLRDDLAELGADALLATREGVVTYLTGYTTHTWRNHGRPVIAVLFADDGLTVLASDAESQALELRVPDVTAVAYGPLTRVPDGARLPDGRSQFMPGAGRALDALLTERGVGTLAVDGLRAIHPPISQVTAALDRWRGELLDASACVWSRRLIKGRWEIARLREAVRVLEGAFDALPDRIAPGMTEREIHRRLAAASFEAGADELGYTGVVVVGRGRDIMGAPTDRVWEPGEVLYVDGGVVVNGYWADVCRQYSAGRPSATQEQGYARAVQARDAALEAFHVGMTAGDLASLIGRMTATRASEHKAGRFGHGIGLYMPEPPSLAAVDDTPLDEGVVLCLEPAAVHDRTHYVVEEEYVVTPNGLVAISEPAPRALIAL